MDRLVCGRRRVEEAERFLVGRPRFESGTPPRQDHADGLAVRDHGGERRALCGARHGAAALAAASAAAFSAFAALILRAFVMFSCWMHPASAASGNLSMISSITLKSHIERLPKRRTARGSSLASRKRLLLLMPYRIEAA